MRLLSCFLLAAVGSLLASAQTPPGAIAPVAGDSQITVLSARPRDPVTASTWARFAAMSAQTIKHAAAEPASVPVGLNELPELSFNEFFGPIGPLGLDYSEKIRALAGRRVRVRGFMVQQTERAPGFFLLAAMPVKVDTRADCNETDTPPAVIHVFVPGAKKALPFVPGPHVLSGTLEIGAHTEADDRISVARLALDESARTALFGPSVDAAPLATK